jgi:hypothetical protein
MAWRPVGFVQQFWCSCPLRGHMMYFYSRSDPANLRNRQVQTREKRGMSIDFLRTPCYFTFHQYNYITNGWLSMHALSHTIQNPAFNGDLPSDGRIAATFVVIVKNYESKVFLRDEKVSRKIVNVQSKWANYWNRYEMATHSLSLSLSLSLYRSLHKRKTGCLQRHDSVGVHVNQPAWLQYSGIPNTAIHPSSCLFSNPH